jgi:riboflavin synthase
MFTGIIKEAGIVRRIDTAGGLFRLDISCISVYERASVGESVAVNGVCLTVTKRSGGVLYFDVMAETARRTTLADLRIGDKVNLENSVRSGGALDGHFVLGHIDCVGSVKEVSRKDDEFSMMICFPAEFSRFLVEKGSVAIDGVSLTIGRIGKGTLSVYIIPHTLKATILALRKPGSRVNMEFDIIGKYVASLCCADSARVTEEFLRANGF